MTSPPAPSIAVVVPCYNAAPWVSRAVTSVLEQDCPGAAVVVVDDGSSDGSAEVIRATFGDRVALLTGPNRGACHARNRGLAWAEETGAPYVMFLDADDYHEGEILAGSLAEAQAHGADMVLSNMHLEYPDGTRELRPRYAGQVTGREFLFGWMQGDYVNPSGIVWRTGFAREIDGWDESLSRAQDLDITLRATLEDPVIRKNEIGAAIHARVNPGSVSTLQTEAALSSRFRAVAGLLDRTKGGPNADIAPKLHEELYSIARAAYKARHYALGRQIQARLATEGHTRHHGTRPHKIVCSLIGLERKTRLWGG